MKEMGMTDRQFNGFIRFLIDDLKEVREEKDEEKKWTGYFARPGRL